MFLFWCVFLHELCVKLIWYEALLVKLLISLKFYKNKFSIFDIVFLTSLRCVFCEDYCLYFIYFSKIVSKYRWSFIYFIIYIFYFFNIKLAHFCYEKLTRVYQKIFHLWCFLLIFVSNVFKTFNKTLVHISYFKHNYLQLKCRLNSSGTDFTFMYRYVDR